MPKDKSLTNENLSCVPETPTKTAVSRFTLLTGQECMRSNWYRRMTVLSVIMQSVGELSTEHLDVRPVLKSVNGIVEKYCRSLELMA
ncbi:hypothetical protein TNCV_3921221 [Trichonephila clavipes]|nr:hypothetical protein TNCV_3921221 [Trichonephila clavipes]